MNVPRTEPADRYFVPTALLELRNAIEDHGGMEVFFVGRPGEVTGKLQTVEALCRGNQNSVPAILDAARFGEVVIHNHPSGVLIPSEADLSLASHYGNLGVGFLIVNNRADEVVVVVKPVTRPVRKAIPAAELEARLGARGELARRMPGYEWRQGQLEMSCSVLKAFNEDGISVVEAGTGTGKSLAYLLPAALSAVANKEVVVVATHTINLQEQLFLKDTPQVISLDGFGDLQVALLKGRSNYLCNRKFEYYRSGPGDLFDTDGTATFKALEDWYASTAHGTRSELSFPVPADLWERLAVDDDDCTRVKCPHYENCFYFKARRQAAGAHILVVNQHLLLADLAVRHATGDYRRAMVLPPYKRIVLDEAHHLESVATSFTSGRVGHRGVGRLLGRLVAARSRGKGNDGEARRGLLVLLARRLADAPLDDGIRSRMQRLIHDDLEPRVEAIRRMLRSYLQEIAFQLKYDMQQKLGRIEAQFRILDAFTHTELWDEVIRDRVQELDTQLAMLAATLDTLLKLWEELPEGFRAAEQQLGLELGGIKSKLVGLSTRLREFLTGGENLVRWIELEQPNSPESSAALCTSPIEVAELLHEMVFEPVKTVVLTSATLSVGGRFDYLKERVGLAKVPARRLEALSIPSPFDYARQVYFGIPADFPDPREPNYQDALIETVETAILHSNGGVFVLFTSYSLLNTVADALRARGRLPYPLLKHGEEQRHALLSRFKSEQNAVLFGTDSFWEGVDVQGEALRQVIITRLPFQVPSEPIQQARAERISARGGDPFREISLPQAVIQFKQGFGRLIRHRDDRGVVLVLDQRIVGKYYGRYFLEAVHGVEPVAESTSQILRDIEDFFAGRYRPRRPYSPNPAEVWPQAAEGTGRFERFRPRRGKP